MNETIPDWYEPGITRYYSMSIILSALEPYECITSGEYEDLYIYGLLPNGKIIWYMSDTIRDAFIQNRDASRFVLSIVEETHVYFVGIELNDGMITGVYIFNTDEQSILTSVDEEITLQFFARLFKMTLDPNAVVEDYSMSLQECELDDDRFYGGFCRAWTLLFAETFCKGGSILLEELYEKLLGMDSSEHAEFIFDYWKNKVEEDIYSTLSCLIEN